MMMPHLFNHHILDKVLLYLLSDADHVSDARALESAEVLLAGGGVGSEEEAGYDLLHVPPHGVRPVVCRAHHEAGTVDIDVGILVHCKCLTLFPAFTLGLVLSC